MKTSRNLGIQNSEETSWRTQQPPSPPIGICRLGGLFDWFPFQILTPVFLIPKGLFPSFASRSLSQCQGHVLGLSLPQDPEPDLVPGAMLPDSADQLLGGIHRFSI
jgi:hypothetical protein